VEMTLFNLSSPSNYLPCCGHKWQDAHIQRLLGHANMITLSQNYIFDGLLRRVIMGAWLQLLDQVHNFTACEQLLGLYCHACEGLRHSILTLR
jgi:hypothetical protein